MITYIAFELEALFKQGVFSHLDYFFAGSMALAFNEKDPTVLASCALVSKLLSEGHICLDIAAMAGMQKPLSETSRIYIKYPDEKPWISALRNSSMISARIQTPLVLDSGYKLYFARYFDLQYRLVDNIARRVSISAPIKDGALMDEFLNTAFPDGNGHHFAQKKAVKHALLKPFTIISGGPGTGKTFVTGIIQKLMSLYAEKKGQENPKILCVAPTGKAASKLEGGSTIHSALRPRGRGTGFYHNKAHPLDKDVVIIDEASMIDLPLLVRLLEAIPLEATVIMAGDKHQLASIQAGAVFADLCAINELHSNIFLLDYNFRSGGKSGIEKLSKAINESDIQGFESLLLSRDYPDLVFEAYGNSRSTLDSLKKHIIEGFGPFGNARDPEDAFGRLDEFRVLCAHNKGEYGTLQVNHICEKILRSLDISGIEKKPYIKAVMVNTNDYEKGYSTVTQGLPLKKREGSRRFSRVRIIN
nr:AAA family ATPase [Desulfobacula sp.]